ncbi:MAG: HigA family addiction module antitoxin [Alphaproteobacteria bacterium]
MPTTLRREYTVKRQPDREPTHPGSILREDVLPALGLSASDAARELGVSRQTLHRIMAGKGAVTADMAVRLGKFCGNGPNLWLNLQSAHDVWHAARRLKAVVAGIRTHRAAA